MPPKKKPAKARNTPKKAAKKPEKATPKEKEPEVAEEEAEEEEEEEDQVVKPAMVAVKKEQFSPRSLQKLRLRPVRRKRERSLRKACLHPTRMHGWMFETKSTPWLKKVSQS